MLHSNICSFQVGDLGYASELGNYAEYSGAPNEEEVLQYARVVIDVRSSDHLRVYVTLFLQSHIILVITLGNLMLLQSPDFIGSALLRTPMVVREPF